MRAREDGEAIDRIEKLIGHKIPRVGAEALKDEAKAEPAPAKAKTSSRSRKPAVEKAVPAEETRQPERSTVVEDIKSEWNGPLPSFLSVSAV